MQDMMAPQLRDLIRAILAFCLYYSGALWLYAAFLLRRRIVILMYHRVLPSDADTFSDDGIVVSPQTFELHLRFLKRYFRPLSLDEVADALESGRDLPSRGCLITFDDGWHDNVTYALPLLRKYSMPAVVFLATDYISDGTCFWQERLARLMGKALERPGPARRLTEDQMMIASDTLPAIDRKVAIRRAITRLKARDAGDRQFIEQTILSELAKSDTDGVGAGDDRFMTWADVGQLVPPAPLTPCSHACTHAPLTELSEADIDQELVESRRKIEAVVGHSVIAVAYPNGDFNDDIVQAARRAGYRLGFTTQKGLVTAGDDPFRLRRLNVHEGSGRSIPLLLCTILGVFGSWPRRIKQNRYE